jgi:hydrogenase maturation factor
MFGEPVGDQPICTSGAQAGDILLQAGYAALEGTAILASEHLDDARLPAQAAAKLADDPGISVLEPALAIAADPGVHALHDPTEGGIATGIREMAAASSLGVRVRADRLLFHPLTEAVCHPLAVDPLGLISSGCLLAAVSPGSVDRVLAALHGTGVPAAAIGRFDDSGRWLLEDGSGRATAIPEFGADELARGA